MATSTLNNEIQLANYFFIGVQTKKPVSDAIEIDDWVNPYSRSTIKPYVPRDSQKVVKTCEEAYAKYLNAPNFNNTGALFYELKEPLVAIFSNLDPKNLANFSEVSKCCYLTTKLSIIWELQMNKLLPNVKILPPERCRFSSAQQFKIIFKRINDEIKPYVCFLKRNNELLNKLRGPNGKNGTIDAAWKDLVKKGGPERAHIGSQSWNYPSKKDIAAYKAHQKYHALESQRKRLAGYDEKVDTIAPGSQQDKLQKAIDSDVRNAYNDQNLFEKTIQISEEAQTSILNLMANSLEDVKDGIGNVIKSIGDIFKKDSNPPDTSCPRNA